MFRFFYPLFFYLLDLDLDLDLALLGSLYDSQ